MYCNCRSKFKCASPTPLTPDPRASETWDGNCIRIQSGGELMGCAGWDQMGMGLYFMYTSKMPYTVYSYITIRSFILLISNLLSIQQVNYLSIISPAEYQPGITPSPIQLDFAPCSFFPFPLPFFALFLFSFFFSFSSILNPFFFLFFPSFPSSSLLLSLSPPFISINLSILSSRPDSSAHLNGFYFRGPVSASTTLSSFPPIRLIYRDFPIFLIPPTFLRW